MFISKFVGVRHHQFLSAHLLSVKQGNDESLKKYIVRFTKKTVRVENCTYAVALTTIMAGLQLGILHYPLAKNAPRTFAELLLRAQKYSNANKLTNAKIRADSNP